MQDRNNLVVWRAHHRLDQQELASAAALSAATLSRIENGQRAGRPETLVAIVEATETLRPGAGLTLDQLVGRVLWEPAQPIASEKSGEEAA